MEAFWSFLRHKRNRDLLGWIGGGLIVIATGFWAIFTYVFPPSAKSLLATAPFGPDVTTR
jgi:hypothetical protein